MLPSNGDTHISNGVLPYVSSLWRQRLEDNRVGNGVGIAPSAQVNCGSIPGRATGLSLLHRVPTGSGSHAWIPETLSALVNRPGCSTHGSSQSTAEVKNDRSFISTSHML